MFDLSDGVHCLRRLLLVNLAEECSLVVAVELEIAGRCVNQLGLYAVSHAHNHLPLVFLAVGSLHALLHFGECCASVEHVQH